MSKYLTTIVVLVVVVGLFFLLKERNEFPLPEGDAVSIEEDEVLETEDVFVNNERDMNSTKSIKKLTSSRKIFVTAGKKHSIALDDVRGGGPGKDGIPSIDDPKFISVESANKLLEDDSPGLGLHIDGDVRFYPYRILVWHEIVNDVVGGRNVVVTYCPLCATGVVYDRGEYEFGVSGLLWESNLLMYNRTGDENTESLWSQVLGEAVVGPNTGEKLEIISSDIIQYGKWKEKYPKTKVLSQNTGASRSYGRDPYGGYYTNDSAIYFPVSNSDSRLANKDFVLGVELNSQYKAYRPDDIKEGTSTDIFAGETITIEKGDVGEIRMFIGTDEITYIGGFWFSWVAVHPETEVYK